MISRAIRMLSNHETEVLDSQIYIPKNKAPMNAILAKLKIQMPNVVKKRSVSLELKNDEPSLMLCLLFSLAPFSSFNELLDLDSVIESTISKNEHPSDEPSVYTRQAALDELREFSRSFNLVVQCSYDIKSAEEEIGVFFPKLQEYQDIILMLRLDAGKLKPQAVELLKKIDLKLINTWQHERETWFHVVKQGARDEVIGVMHYNCLITEPLGA